MWSKELSNVKALTYNNTNKQHKTLAWEYYKSTHFIVKGLRVMICTGWKFERRNKVQNLVPPNWLEKKHKLNISARWDWLTGCPRKTTVGNDGMILSMIGINECWLGVPRIIEMSFCLVYQMLPPLVPPNMFYSRDQPFLPHGPFSC